MAVPICLVGWVRAPRTRTAAAIAISGTVPAGRTHMAVPLCLVGRVRTPLTRVATALCSATLRWTHMAVPLRLIRRIRAPRTRTAAAIAISGTVAAGRTHMAVPLCLVGRVRTPLTRVATALRSATLRWTHMAVPLRLIRRIRAPLGLRIPLRRRIVTIVGGVRSRWALIGKNRDIVVVIRARTYRWPHMAIALCLIDRIRAILRASRSRNCSAERSPVVVTVLRIALNDISNFLIPPTDTFHKTRPTYRIPGPTPPLCQSLQCSVYVDRHVHLLHRSSVP